MKKLKSQILSDNRLEDKSLELLKGGKEVGYCYCGCAGNRTTVNKNANTAGLLKTPKETGHGVWVIVF